MQILLDVILPVFLVIGFGWTAARARLFDDGAIDGVMRFAQNFAVPCLLFRGVARLDVSTAFHPSLLVSFYAGAAVAFVLGVLGARLLFSRPATDAIAIGFAAWFSNSLLIGLPITERAFGPDALSGNFAIIATHSPLLYGVGITVMEIVRSRGTGLSVLAQTRRVLRGVFSQPLVIGVTLGLAVNLTGLPVPGVGWQAIDMMAAVSVPAALFGLGGVLNRYRPTGDLRTILMVCALSLAVHPAITFGLGHAFGLQAPDLRSAVVTAAASPGVNAYLFAHLYGVAMRVAASSVLIGTALCLLTAWFWLSVLP